MLYEITMTGTVAGEQFVNRWNYLSSGVGASVSGSFGLVYAFGAIPEVGVYDNTKPFFKIMAMLSQDTLVRTIVARAAALYDPEDFYERPFPTPYAGTNPSPCASPLLSFGFRTNRVRLDIDRGTKRLAGVAENTLGAGGHFETTVITQMTGVAAAMSDVLEYDDEGSVFSYTPCVVSKLKYTTESGKSAYKYYPTLVDQLLHVASGVTWQPYTETRSQTSRQYGRGN